MRIKQKNIFFHEMDCSEVNKAVVILDIDGTVTCSSKDVVDEKVLNVIRKLQEKNSVYIFSNNFNGSRSKKIAKDINVTYVQSPHRKPNKKVLQYIKERSQTVVVIGDKYLTDGLFAQLTRSEYIRVKRYKCEQDSIADKAACLLDDIMYFFAKLFRLVE